jgi:hypothetical protein
VVKRLFGEVEAVIYQHLAVREAAAFKPDSQGRTRRCAGLGWKPGTSASEDELIVIFVVFANYKIPRRVELSDTSFRRAVPARS